MEYESNGELHATIHRMDKELAVLRTRLEEKEEALKLQALEYERRLDILNHAHQEAKDVLATYMPRELADRNWSQLSEWQRRMEVSHQNFVTRDDVKVALEALDARIALLTEYRQKVMGRFGALSDVWGWLVGAAGVGIAFISFWWNR